MSDWKTWFIRLFNNEAAKELTREDVVLNEVVVDGKSERLSEAQVLIINLTTKRKKYEDGIEDCNSKIMSLLELNSKKKSNKKEDIKYVKMNKDKARELLKIKKSFEKKLNENTVKIDNLREVIDRLTQAQENVKIVNAQKNAVNAIKNIYKNTDKALKDIDDIAETMQETDEINTALNESISKNDYDDEQLDEELEGMILATEEEEIETIQLPKKKKIVEKDLVEL